MQLQGLVTPELYVYLLIGDARELIDVGEGGYAKSCLRNGPQAAYNPRLTNYQTIYLRWLKFRRLASQSTLEQP
jgi:hypothetical protein